MGFLDFGETSDAGIDRYDQADTLLVELLQSGYLQSVALGNAMWDVGNDRAAKAGQPLNQQRCSGDAISIEIPVDGDFLPGKQSLVDSAYSLMHVRQQEGVDFQALVSAQENLYLGRL